MEKIIVDFLNKNNIDTNKKKVVIAVSTGADSMALLKAVSSLGFFEVIVAHVNHQKRIESIIEEDYIKNYCLDNNIKCYTTKFDFSNIEGDNFQSIARAKRYEFFLSVLEKEEASYLMLAHHAIDNMETILMRLLRGSSLKGYAGIPSIIAFHGFTILRPFLSVTKDELLKYVNDKKIKYYFDSSNDSDIYTRNRIRKEIIPLLFKENPNAHLKFLEFGDTISSSYVVIEKIVNRFIEENVNYSDNNFSFSIKDFSCEDYFIQVEVLFTLLKKYMFSKNNILEILKIIFSSKPNLLLDYKGIGIVKEYDEVTMYNSYSDIVDIGPVNIEINEIKEYEINDTMCISVTKKSVNHITLLDEICYNSEKFPLVVRSRKAGDKIVLSKGTKKVKDVLIDLKVRPVERNNALVLQDSEGNILGILGIKKSSLLKNEKVNNIIIKLKRV